MTLYLVVFKMSPLRHFFSLSKSPGLMNTFKMNILLKAAIKKTPSHIFNYQPYELFRGTSLPKTVIKMYQLYIL